MSGTIQFKRGDTLKLSCTYMLDGVAATTPVGIQSQVRTHAGVLVAELVVSRVDDATGRFDLSCADTTAWPITVLQCDIQYTDANGNIASTDNLAIQVLRDITHA